MANADDLLTRRVSYQESVWTDLTGEPSVQEVLNDIRESRYADRIDHLRDLICRGEREQYGVDKKHLPCVTFSGTFDGNRQIAQLKEYNELLVLDVDHMPKEDLMAARSALAEDLHVLACWTSPSGEGLKGLVGLSFSEELAQIEVVEGHLSAFCQISDYFQRTHGIDLDQSGKDIPRLCFLSSDPSLHLRADATPFFVSEIAKSVRRKTHKSIGQAEKNEGMNEDVTSTYLLNRTEGKNERYDRAVMGSILQYLSKRKTSITTSYDCWVRVAYSIASTFTYNIGEGYFLRLCRLDGDAHDENGSIRLLRSCYCDNRGCISFATIRHYAQEAGYKGKCDDRD